MRDKHNPLMLTVVADRDSARILITGLGFQEFRVSKIPD